MKLDTNWAECENAIEWRDIDKTATVTLHGKRLINRVLKLAESHPEDVTLKALPEDNHGYLVASVPRGWVRISPPQQRNYTEEQKAVLRERIAGARNRLYTQEL